MEKVINLWRHAAQKTLISAACHNTFVSLFLL